MLHHVDVGTLRSAMRLAWRNAAPARLADRAIFADAKEGLPTTITSPAYFTTPEAFRAWLHKHHRTHDELVVGFWKVGTGKPSITWQQSVAEALCYGWIDGIRRSLSAATYTIRFTPRRRNSAWSAINIRLMAELESAGRMTAAGRAAFDARPHKTGAKAAGYKAQKKDATLDAGRLRTFRHHGSGKAWTFFQSQPPGYRKAAMWWVMQAKQKATRDRRLARLLEVSAKGKRLS
jgi:uncharacterized protein YdeI (YjbR/CyaY-like superfamily)